MSGRARRWLSLTLLLLLALPLQAQQTLSGGGVKLDLAADGSIAGVAIGGKPWPLTQPALSGLLLRDAAAKGDFVAAGGAVTAAAGGLKHAGTNTPLKLDFEATYRVRPGAIAVSGFIHDLSGADRAITVRFALPLQGRGATWWQDLLASEPIAERVHSNLRSTGVGATGSSSAYPWAAVSAAPGEICLGVPMDHFVVHRLAYDGQSQTFTLDFDFGLSPLTKAFPSRADFSFVIYSADPRWGFRSATAAYYDLFPESFVRRAKSEGLWMPFSDISRVQDPEDFNFIFQEGGANIPWDDAHGIYSFRYISPHWAWLWMPERQEKPTAEFIQQKLAEDLKSPDERTRRLAELIVSCSARNAKGDYHYSIGQAHWAPHKTGHLGWYALYPANADPDLALLGNRRTTGSETMEYVEKEIAAYNKPGAFLDGFYFDGVDERPLDNYATDQFACVDSPLTFGKGTHRPIICGAFSSYKFVKRVAEKMWASNRLVMANGVPASFPFVTAYLDVGGSEQEPSVESPPVSMDYLTYARTLMCRKPLVLLYKPRLEERFDRDLSPYLVDYMHACLPYAAEPSMFMIFSNTDPSFYHRFWERADWYNKYRSIFVNYVPLVKRLALAGWEPVTRARASDPRIIVERFGTRDLYLVAHNPEREGTPASFDLELEPGLLPNAQSCAANLVDGSSVPVTPLPQGGLRLRLTLAPRRSAVLALAPVRQQLTAFDLGEAARYGQIASQRLREKLNPALAVNFESDPSGGGTPTGFRPYREGDVNFSSDTTGCHSAPRCTKVVMTGKARGVQSTEVKVQPGLKYRFSLWAKADLPTPGGVDFYIRWKDVTGKDGAVQSSPALTATSDWKQLELEATAPADAAGVMLALVTTHRSEGSATLWFDDPTVVALGANGQQTTLLPVSPVTPAPAVVALGTALQKRGEQLQQLAASAPGATDATALCRQALALAFEVETQATGVREQLPEHANVAAALETSARRLQRAAGVLAGWQLALTGGGPVALGETPHFEARVTGGAVSFRKVSLTLTQDGRPVTPAPAAFPLKPGEVKALAFTVSAPASLGSTQRVGVTARAELADGQSLTLERDASVTLVSACESGLEDQGLDVDGRVRRLLLTVHNMRREKALPVTVTVAPPAGFASSVARQSVEVSPGAQFALPLSLTAGEQQASAWVETTVKVAWDGGEQVHHQAQLYCPPSANLLKSSGFEGEPQGVTAAWRAAGKNAFVVDGKQPHSGHQAIRVTGPDAGACQRLELNQTVARPLVLRGYSRYEPPAAAEGQQVMTIGQTEQAPAAGGSVARRSPEYSLYVDLHYVGGGALYGQTATFDKATAGWQFSERIINVNRPIKDATVYLLFRNQQGTAWFDDIFLAEAEPDLALLPGTQVTADSTYSGYTTAPLVDGVTDTERVPWDQAAWASEDRKGEHWVELTFPREVTLKTVVVYWAVDVGNTWTSRDYKVQVPAGEGWRDVATVTAQTRRDLSIHPFAPLQTTRLRLLQLPGGGNAARPNIMWLRELAAY